MASKLVVERAITKTCLTFGFVVADFGELLVVVVLAVVVLPGLVEPPPDGAPAVELAAGAGKLADSGELVEAELDRMLLLTGSELPVTAAALGLGA